MPKIQPDQTAVRAPADGAWKSRPASGVLGFLQLERPDLIALAALTAVAFILRFFSPLMPDILAHPFSSAPASNCVQHTPVDTQGRLGTLCGLAYPYQRGTVSTPGARPEPPEGEVFDEIYFAAFAHDDLKGINYFDDKPPVGKLIIAAGEWIWGWFRATFQGARGDYADLGFTPFGWRIMSVLFGTLLIPLVYLLAFRIWRNRFFAVAAGVLACFDGLLFVQSRIAMIDIFLVFFILLAYWLFLLHRASRTSTESSVTLLLTGVALGLGIATKWSALAAWGTIVFFMIARFLRRRFDFAVETPRGAWRWRAGEPRGPSVPGAVAWPVYLLVAVVALIAIPFLIYVASWFPFFLRGQFHGLADIIAQQKAAYDFNAHLKATHPYASAWFSWPFLYRPVLYYYQPDGLGTDAWTGRPLVAGILDLGNPWIWWTSLPCLVLLVYFILKRRSFPAAFLAVAFLAQLLPWALVTRVLFLFEMTAAVPFMVLALAFVLATVAESDLEVRLGGLSLRAAGRTLASIHLGVAILAFVYFYPVWTGLPISDQAYLGGFPGGKMWFPRWI